MKGIQRTDVQFISFAIVAASSRLDEQGNSLMLYSYSGGCLYQSGVAIWQVRPKSQALRSEDLIMHILVIILRQYVV
jgi:hypothetical protein